MTNDYEILQALNAQTKVLKHQEYLQVAQIKLLMSIALDDGLAKTERLNAALEVCSTVEYLGYKASSIHDIIAKYEK